MFQNIYNSSNIRRELQNNELLKISIYHIELNFQDITLPGSCSFSSVFTFTESSFPCAEHMINNKIKIVEKIEAAVYVK